MADRPILFSAPMVRALLAGTKTQTRRLLTKPKWADPGSDFEIEADGPYIVAAATGCTAKAPVRIAAGDRLWVKETSRITSWGEDGEVWLTYGADEAKSGMLLPRDEDFLERLCARVEKAGAETDALGMYVNIPPGALVKPSIFMPRWASRMTLSVTDVRVERLQDISETDAAAEGIVRVASYPMADSDLSDPLVGYSEEEAWSHDPKDPLPIYELPGSAKAAYRRLWNQINGADAWKANPWVAAYTFTVELGNIDQLRAAA